MKILLLLSFIPVLAWADQCRRHLPEDSAMGPQGEALKSICDQISDFSSEPPIWKDAKGRRWRIFSEMTSQGNAVKKCAETKGRLPTRLEFEAAGPGLVAAFPKLSRQWFWSDSCQPGAGCPRVHLDADGTTGVGVFGAFGGGVYFVCVSP